MRLFPARIASRTASVVIAGIVRCGLVVVASVVTAGAPAAIAATATTAVIGTPSATATPSATGTPSATATSMDIGGPPLDMRLARIGRLEPGRGIRVWIPEGDQIDGRFLGSRHDSLVIATDRRVVTIPLHVVDALWIQRRATAKGARIGLISGTLAGVTLGGLLAILNQSLCDTGDCGGDALRIMGGMTLLGAAGGTALGTAIGSQTWEWDRRYGSGRQ